MALAPVFSDCSFHTFIGEKKPPQGKLCGGDCFRGGPIRQFEALPTVSLAFRAKSPRPVPLFARQVSQRGAWAGRYEASGRLDYRTVCLDDEETVLHTTISRRRE